MSPSRWLGALSQTSPSRIPISWMPAIVGQSASAFIEGTQFHQT